VQHDGNRRREIGGKRGGKLAQCADSGGGGADDDEVF
jgi:hypothetical protein